MNPILISKTPCQTGRKSSLRTWALIASVATIITAVTSTSCATTQGFGRDVKKVGNEIEDAAR